MVQPARAAYFFIEEGKERCFQEDITLHQVLRMSYSMHDKAVLDDASEGTSECKITVKNPDGKVVKEHALLKDNHEGVLAMAAQSEGSHSVCMKCESQSYFGKQRKMRWSIVFDVLGTGLSSVPDVKKLASVANLKKPQDGIEQLLERVSAIFNENDYERNFEAKFVRASDAVNSDITGFKVFQIILIIGVSAFQITHLAQFLKSRMLDCGIGCMPMFHKRGPTV